MRPAELLGRVLGRFRGAIIYAAICAAIIFGFHDRAWQHVATLNGEEWQPIQDFIRPHRRGDEPICFLPGWTRGHAVDQYKFRSIDVLDSPEEAWEGRDEPVSGFWVVSQFDAFDPDDVPEDLYPYRVHRRLSQADIFLFRRSPIPALPDSLVFHLHEAACVYHGPGDRRLRLEWRRLGYYLPLGHPETESHDYIGCRVTHDRFAGRPHFGIWFHPPVPGRAVSLTWPRVELQPWLEVGGGLTDAVAARRGASVDLQVILDGRTIQRLSFPPQRGWKVFAVETGRSGGVGRLSLKVTTKQNHSRHFVFDAEMKATRPRATPPARPPRRPPVRAGAGPAETDEGDAGTVDASGEGGDDSPEEG